MVQKNILNCKKVLIVDDEPDILDTLEETLSMCDISRAKNLEEAKKLLRRSSSKLLFWTLWVCKDTNCLKSLKREILRQLC